jgi:putative transposase
VRIYPHNQKTDSFVRNPNFCFHEILHLMRNQHHCKYPPGYNALRQGRWSQAGQYYMVTAVTEKREPVLRQYEIGRIVVREMMGLHDEGKVKSLAWVLMPDHLHWLLALGNQKTLPEVVRLLKGRSARGVNNRLKRTGKLWQRGFYDHALRKDEDVLKLARYIVANPIRAGIINKIGDYPLWDAVWLSKNL